ncbi:hypothetical protein LIPSTDRAFT_106129 [Lipomyces starkeyi NRRL Y-11557]|uniref:Uncharacterized protein n=1 Tax=Lipomyces starkeyi NRRL Y-11557 TaxID=675824 RepID=A0A1E3Q3U7_LIPST|nr:hypothetical protein LIPSTDRAFT_106129 [Lipomyces starkeyi NRRL Y-11557]
MAPLCPYVHGNFTWVGQMSNFALEVYRKRGKSDQPKVTRHVRIFTLLFCASNLVEFYVIVENGPRIQEATINLNIKICELAPIAEVRKSEIASTPTTLKVEDIL